MSDPVRAGDVLMYINSLKIVRVLPPDSRDAAIGALQDHGAYTFVPQGWSGHGGFLGDTPFNAGHYGGRPIETEELTEDEETAIRLVLTLAHDHGRSVHIVDIGRETSFHRYIEEHRHHLKQFPVLLRPDGRRLDGIEQFSRDRLGKFFSD